jgi:hypothetical protein
MVLTKEHQRTFLDLLEHDFKLSKEYFPMAWDGWKFIRNFDRHSPCVNMAIVTPNGSEVKIFVPNSDKEDLYNEEYSRFSVWFNCFGMGENEDPLEFKYGEDVVGYLFEQWVSGSL